MRLLFIGLALGLAVALIVPIAIFGRVAISSVEVDLAAQATAERARVASTVARLVEDTLVEVLRDVGQTTSRPPFAGQWYLRDPAPVEAALADLIRTGRYRHAAVYLQDLEVPVAVVALGEAGAVLMGSSAPSILRPVGQFKERDGGARVFDVFRDEVVRRGLEQQIVYSRAFPVPPVESMPGAFNTASAAVFVVRSVPPASNGSIVVAPRLDQIDERLELFIGAGRTVRVLARDAGNEDHVVILSGPDQGSTIRASDLAGIEETFEGARGSSRGAPPGRARQASISEGGEERLAAYAPVHGGAWVVAVTDDPSVTLGTQRALADGLRDGSLVGVVVAGGLALTFAFLLGLVERQRRALAASLAQNIRLIGKIEAASTAKSRFLASMSHELRTPLNSIIGFSQVLRQRMYGELNEKQGDYVSDIEGSGQHLLGLINEVLDLSKVEAGKMDLRPQETAIAELVGETLHAVTGLADRKRIRLTLDVDGPPELVFHDPGRLRQVLLNLLSNAVKFTPEGGTVTTRLAGSPGAFDLSVRDTGIGISEADLPSIFEEFGQVASAQAGQQGTGLGLALVKGFVDLMGGTIAVTSTVGVGSVFTVRLPVRQPEPSTVSA